MKRIVYSSGRAALWLILALLTTTSWSWAQPDAAWSTRLSQIEWLRVTSLGYPLVSSLGQLSALDPETGEIRWTNKTLGTLEYHQLEDVWGTPYVKISYGDPEDDALPMIALLDVTTGNVLFDSNKERVSVLGSYPLPQSQRFLVVAVSPGKFSATLLMYDMTTGQKLWENTELFKGGGQEKRGMLAKMASAIESVVNMQSLTSDPLEIDNDHILITHPSYVIKLNSSDGSTVWRSKIEESTRAQLLFAPHHPGKVFVAAETESQSMMTSSDGGNTLTYLTNYYCFDLATGQSPWKSPVRNSNERLNHFIATENGILILPGISGNQRTTLNLIDYQTGETKWGNKGKGVKSNGEVVDLVPLDGGYVVSLAAKSVFQGRDDNYFINRLDVENGTLLFDKPIKIKGRLVFTEVVPRGILYATTHEVNILHPTTGAPLIPDGIESGGPKRLDKALPFPTASRDNKLYVFATREGILKELDKTTGTVRNLNTAKLQFEGKEIPKSLDAFDEGVAICSDQNVAMIGYDGSLKFIQYFPPPKQSGLMRALALAEAVKGMYATAMLASMSVAAGEVAATTTDQDVRQLGAELASGTAVLTRSAMAYTGKALADFNKRFKATTTTDDFLIVLSEVAPRDFRLLQINKHTGETMATFDLGKDRDPLYDLDLMYNHVYYQSRPSEISCFKLK